MAARARRARTMVQTMVFLVSLFICFSLLGGLLLLVYIAHLWHATPSQRNLQNLLGAVVDAHSTVLA